MVGFCSVEILVAVLVTVLVVSNVVLGVLVWRARPSSSTSDPSAVERVAVTSIEAMAEAFIGVFGAASIDDSSVDAGPPPAPSVFPDPSDAAAFRDPTDVSLPAERRDADLLDLSATDPFGVPGLHVDPFAREH